MFSKCESCHCCEIGSGRQTLIITLLKKDDMRKRGLKLSEMILIVLDRRQMVRWITFEWPTSATVVLPRALSVHPHWQQHAYVSSNTILCSISVSNTIPSTQVILAAVRTGIIMQG